MNLLNYLIPILLIFLGILLVRYDRNKELKNKHITWLSKNLFRDNSGLNASAARLHQTILGFFFVVCVGIGALFVIGVIE